MLKQIEMAYIRKMAKSYKDIQGLPIKKAVFEAYKAYDFYKDAEMEVMYEEYERT